MSHKWTGFEAAIVLIALVVVASVFSYVVLGTQYPGLQPKVTPSPTPAPTVSTTPCDCACGYTQLKINGYADNGYGNEMVVYDMYFNPYRCMFWVCNGIERGGCYEALIFTDRAGEKHIVSVERVIDCKDCITGQCSN